MKTILTIFLFLLCSISFGQTDSLTGTSGKKYPLYLTTVPGRSMTGAFYFGSVMDFYVTEINKLKAEVAALKAGGLDPALKVDVAVLKMEVQALKADTATFVLEGFVLDSLTGRYKVDPNVVARMAGIKSYTTAERDAAFKAGILKVGDIIFNKSTLTFQGRTASLWKAL